MGRYISSNEAIWRIFTFPIHERDPAVIHLAVHLENGQRVYFTEETALQQALTAPKTTLTEFFNLCRRQDAVGQFARTLMYTDVPKYFTWNKQSKNWEPRKRGIPVPGFSDIFMTNTLGRLYTVHPKQRECFFLRLLLVNVTGPTSFQYLRKVNGTSYNDVQREHQFDKTSLATFVAENEQLLTAEQRNVYDQINVSIAAQQGGFFFLDAPGGTGKTFIIALILAQIRSQNHIALAIASSGIAATLLDGGRTAHSALKLPLNVHTNPEAMCNKNKHSDMAEVLRKCKIIIWDECTMAHKHSLEALDRSLKDIKNNARLFGGALLLLSGDFRQILPVIPRATYADEINACLKESYLWPSVTKLCLTINMRVRL